MLLVKVRNDFKCEIDIGTKNSYHITMKWFENVRNKQKASET